MGKIPATCNWVDVVHRDLKTYLTVETCTRWRCALASLKKPCVKQSYAQPIFVFSINCCKSGSDIKNRAFIRTRSIFLSQKRFNRLWAQNTTHGQFLRFSSCFQQVMIISCLSFLWMFAPLCFLSFLERSFLWKLCLEILITIVVLRSLLDPLSAVV